MRPNPPFAAFGRRLALGYAVLAVALIAIVAGVATAVAFHFYAGVLDQSVDAAAQKARALSVQYRRQGLTLAQYGPRIVKELDRSQIHVFVHGFEPPPNLLPAPPLPRASGALPRPPPTRRIIRIVADRKIHAVQMLLGLHPRLVRVPDGLIVVTPDIRAISHLLAVYFAVLVPAGAIAVVLAWLLGLRITARAIAPLRDVTRALRRIAGGDLTPEPLLERNLEFADLTSAYNDVAFRLNAAAAERQRNETQMRQFIADAGHELRTPLTVVMGYLDMLRAGAVADQSAVQRLYATMLAESRRMRITIEKLIFLARLDQPESASVASFDLSDEVARVVGTLAPLAGQDRLRLHAAGPAPVEADRGELGEAIKNIIENAIRYAPQSPIDVGVTRDGGQVRVVVTDRGPGMTPSEIEHVYDRFYRGSAPTAGGGDAIEGSGLGLAIAKRAVERAGGRIAITSRPGIETQVEVTLPAK